MCSEFSSLRNEKLKVGIFDGIQIRKRSNDETFVSHITEIEDSCMDFFCRSCESVLGQKESGRLPRKKLK